MTEPVTSLSPTAPEVSKATPLPAAKTHADTPVTQPTDFQNISLHTSQCKTFGEKAFSGVFDWGINFGLNLALSAAFTHYVSHSSRPIWKGASFGKEFFHKSPETAYGWVRDSIMHRTGASRDVASRMTDALTLTTGGHLIMVPSVWLGAKCKAGFVEGLDNWYYGKEKAEQDPWLQARHDAVEHSAKPTFLGTVVGRAGTVAAVQLTSITLGAKKNLITGIGHQIGSTRLQSFKGLNDIAGKFGHAIGAGFADAAPGLSKKMNDFARKRDFKFSTEQIDELLKKDGIRLSASTEHDSAILNNPAYKQRYQGAFDAIRKKDYDSATADYSKYTALDTLYTGVTMYTIHPIINTAKNLLPGMTYHDQPTEKPDTKVASIKSAGKIAYPEHAHEVSV